MGQTVNQIEDHIESSREDLRSSLEELGQKVKSAVDWRERVRANPGATLAVAFGGGFILASILSGSRVSHAASRGRQAALRGPVVDRKGEVLRAWDDIQSALVGVIAAKVTSTLAKVIPGFKEQFAAGEDEAGAANGGSGAH